MQLRNLLRFLIGDRRAILLLASSRWTVPLGLLFVLSLEASEERPQRE